jgi:hypothetical protein
MEQLKYYWINCFIWHSFLKIMMMPALKGKELASNIKFSIKVSLNHSLVLAGLFSIVFAIARIVGLAKQTDIHYVNFLIAFFVAYDSLDKSYLHNKEYINYFSGIMIGAVTVILGHLWYSILFFFYLLIDTDFTQFLLQQLPQIFLAPRLSIAVMLFSEGAGLSVIIGLVLIQYFQWKKKMDPYLDNKR